MKKNILIYGLIAGTVVSVLMLFSIGNIADFNTGLIAGYTSMLIAFSLVFVGIRNYRDTYNNGIISFGKAFKVGIAIVLIASTMYVIAWLIEYFYFVPGYLEKFSVKTLEKLRADGASQMEINNKRKEMANFAIMYQNPILQCPYDLHGNLARRVIGYAYQFINFKKKNCKKYEQLKFNIENLFKRLSQT